MGLAQSATDAYLLSQPDLRGTARYMSMGGAFGALGGDLSVLTQNPGGIGVYRSSEIGFTLDLEMQNSKSTSHGVVEKENNTHFYLNNIGAVATIKLPTSIMPNLNIGFTYHKAASFNKRYKGTMPNLPTSLSNYVAGIANTYDLTEADLTTTSTFDPYNPGYGQTGAPWITILGYDSYLISPEGNVENPRWYGQFGRGTHGYGNFDVCEKGSVEEYNIAFGGNIANVLFWGMDFGITSIDYKLQSIWGESLYNAYVFNPRTENLEQMDANWQLINNYRLNGNGFNYKLGVIVKPIQQLRLGVAFHTPTYYNLNETFYNEEVDFDYPFQSGYAVTDNGYPSYNDVNLRTPWKVIASGAAVLGSKLILSFDYEWDSFKSMRYSEPSSGYYDPWYEWDYPWYDPWGYYFAPGKNGAPLKSYSDPMAEANKSIKTIYRNSNTFRVGAEFRVIPSISLRAGYSHNDSPVTSKAKNELVNIPAAGTIASYRLDKATDYITAGIGFRSGGFYTDFAYVYKIMKSDYYPFSADPENPFTSIANSKLQFSNSQIVMTMGVKF